jgi:hypothetical protein
MPVQQFLFCIGVPELAFGLTMLISASPVGNRIATTADFSAKAMRVWMVGPLAAHFLGDDWSLPMESNVGPTGFVPAAVALLLLILRGRLSSEKSKAL